MDPVTILATIGSVLASTGHLAVQISELVQTPEEVEAALSEITKCERKLGELIKLRKKHATLLAQRPDDEQRIEDTIQETWEALGRAMPLLERNKVELSSRRSKQTSPPPSSKNPVAGLGKRVRWRIQDEGMYRIHEKAILRNQIEVRDQISRLEQIVRFGPLEAAVEQARVEEVRRQQVLDINRAGGDVNSLEFLDRITVKEWSQLESSSSTGSLVTGSELVRPASIGATTTSSLTRGETESSFHGGIVADLVALGLDM